jgi:uncharacterized protein with PQ loop repeat
MAHETSQVLAAVVMLYGLAAALAVLLQARQMLARGSSCEVSTRFLATYVGGYAIWLVYGLSLGNGPIVVVDALGLVCGVVTLAVALKLRGALLSPTSWNQCGSRDPHQIALSLLSGRRFGGSPNPARWRRTMADKPPDPEKMGTPRRRVAARNTCRRHPVPDETGRGRPALRRIRLPAWSSRSP